MIYFIDGTKEGFLTAFLLAFPDPDSAIASSEHQLALGQQCAFVTADEERAKRAERRFLQLDGRCMRELDTLLRSGEKNKEQIAFRYLRLIAQKQRPVRDMLADADVLAASECMARVGHEAERLKGFVRFLESASGALYAPISPDNDICDLLGIHFRARLPGYPFVIHDVSRKKASVWDGEHLFLAPLERAEVLLSADEEAWQSLWREYYRSVNIPSRLRLKQMRGYLPVRYRKFMPEFK